MTKPTYMEKKLADQLHELHCRYRHADQCDWIYGGWSDDPRGLNWAHREYLEKARILIGECNIREISTWTMSEHLGLVLKVMKS